MSLEDDTNELIGRMPDPEHFTAFLARCLEADSIEALRCVQRLFDDDYGGVTFNTEFKGAAAHCLMHWGRIGIDALFETTINRKSVKNVQTSFRVLSAVAAGVDIHGQRVYGRRLIPDLLVIPYHRILEFRLMARQKLVEVMLSLDDDVDVALYSGTVLFELHMQNSDAARVLYSAIAARWMAIGRPVLDRFERLLVEARDDEPRFQEFLTEHPQILDPMAIQIWPQPNLFGAAFPDFVVRRSDDTYLIIEIERPGKTIVTESGQLSADVTHAEQQVVHYRRFLMQRVREVQSHFPRFDEPDALVVIGLLSQLDRRKKEILDQANLNRRNLRIVGFDWLANRAKSIGNNMIEHGVEVTMARLT